MYSDVNCLMLIVSNKFFSPSVPNDLKLASSGFNRDKILGNEKYDSKVLLEWTNVAPSKTRWTLKLTLHNSGWR